MNKDYINISKKRENEINKILLDTEKKIFSGEAKMYSLKEFKDYQNKKRNEIKNVQSRN